MGTYLLLKGTAIEMAIKNYLRSVDPQAKFLSNHFSSIGDLIKSIEEAQAPVVLVQENFGVKTIPDAFSPI